MIFPFSTDELGSSIDDASLKDLPSVGVPFGLGAAGRPGQGNRVLRQLGVSVDRKGEAPIEREEGGTTMRGEDWSEAEVSLVVADYLDMLRRTARPHTARSCSPCS